MLVLKRIGIWFRRLWVLQQWTWVTIDDKHWRTKSYEDKRKKLTNGRTLLLNICQLSFARPPHDYLRVTKSHTITLWLNKLSVVSGCKHSPVSATHYSVVCITHSHTITMTKFNWTQLFLIGFQRIARLMGRRRAKRRQLKGNRGREKINRYWSAILMSNDF